MEHGPTLVSFDRNRERIRYSLFCVQLFGDSFTVIMDTFCTGLLYDERKKFFRFSIDYE